MDSHFQQIRSTIAPENGFAKQLVKSGFSIVHKAFSKPKLNVISAAYNEIMASASGPNFKFASNTTRMSDLLSYSPAFDDVFVHPALLEACAHVINEPFKLSSFVGRTLRDGTAAQQLHADLPRDSPDAPLLGFILMIDPFGKENGSTRFVPGSHCWPDLPVDQLSDSPTSYQGEVLGCGDAGSMVVFDGAIWHGHTANVTSRSRRSIQGTLCAATRAQDLASSIACLRQPAIV